MMLPSTSQHKDIAESHGPQRPGAAGCDPSQRGCLREPPPVLHQDDENKLELKL